MRWMHKSKVAWLIVIFAALAKPAGAETIAQLFPPPPLAPLTMTAVNGTQIFKSEHRGVFDGQRVRYEAAVEGAVIDDPGAVPAANLYAISYVAHGTTDPHRRPVVFLFNGGPGGSSIWLHLCALGPRILRDCSPKQAADPRTPLIENHQSPLNVADLVFIDPTDTGWSHTLPGVSPAQFHSVDGDSEEVTALIVWWLRKHGRLQSPVYIYGESYGSVRAVAVVRDLARSTPKISVSGLILGGFCITFGPGTGTTDPVWDAMRLPTAASMAWHYGKIDNKHQTWTEAVDKAMVFARTEYVAALIQGDQLDPAERERLIEHLPGLSGMPESYFRSHNTIQVGDFENQLLIDKGLVLDDDNGLWTHPVGETRRLTLSPVRPQIVEQYAAGELGVRGLGPYEIITPNIMSVFQQWDFRVSGDPSMEVTLAQEMENNPKLQLMVVQGRYDTLTQVADTLYILDQTHIPRARLKMAYFDGGHMLEPKPEAIRAIRAFLSPMSPATVAMGDRK